MPTCEIDGGNRRKIENKTMTVVGENLSFKNTTVSRLFSEQFLVYYPDSMGIDALALSRNLRGYTGFRALC